MSVLKWPGCLTIIIIRIFYGKLQTKEVVEQKYLAQIESLAAKWECEKNSALHDQLLRYLHDLSEPMTVHDHVVAIRALLEKELLESRLRFSCELKAEPPTNIVKQENIKSEDAADGDRERGSSSDAGHLYEQLCDTIEKSRLNFEDLCSALIKEVNAAKDAFVLNENNRVNELQSGLLEAKNRLVETDRQLDELNRKNESLNAHVESIHKEKMETLQKLEEVKSVCDLS